MKPAAILDIGSSKVVCLCGSRANEDGVIVHGAGVAACEGFRDGEFPDKESLRSAIVDALQKAEQESRIRIRDVAVTVPASFTKLVLTSATVAIGENRAVEKKDIDALLLKTFEKCGKLPGYTLMHSTPVFFLVDGVTSAEEPTGIRTKELSALVSHMFAKEEFFRTVSEALDDLGVEISMCVSAQLGEAVMLIPDKERVRPAVLIDVGYYQTDIAVAENGALTGLTTIPVGGFHFASDLAFGLDVPLEAAEQAKRRFVFSLEEDKRLEVIRTATGSKKVSRSAISFIIEARADEFSSLIRKELENLKINLDARPAIYVSGGGFLMMRGALDHLRSSLHVSLKRDMPWTPRLSTPNYCSAFGALDFVLKMRSPEQAAEKEVLETGQLNALLQKIKNVFTKK